MKRILYVSSFIFTICFMITGCKQSNTDENNSIISEVSESEMTTQEESSYIYKEYPVKNHLFKEDGCKKIRYWIKGEGIEISDKYNIEKVLNILSSVNVSEEKNKDEIQGGIFVDIIYDDSEVHITLFSNRILYNGNYYKTESDILEKLTPFIEDYFMKNGLENYISE